MQKEILEYMQVMNDRLDDKDVEIKQLREKVASANVKVEKQASVASKLADLVVDKLIELGAVDNINKEASVSAIEREPEKVLDFMNKLASVSSESRSARRLGNVINSDTTPKKIGSAADALWEERFGAKRK